MQTERIDIEKVSPGAYQPLYDLNKYISNSSLSKRLFHLIKVRASFINGCGYCVQSHTKDAVKDDESINRLFALITWEDVPYFTTEERAILALTDEVTRISENGVSDEVYNRAIQLLGKEKVAVAIMAIACINAWNRIGRATLLIPD